MDVHHLLLSVVVLTHALMALTWWTAGAWLGLSRKAAMHWFVSALANGAALALMVANTRAADDTTLVLLAAVCGLFAQVSTRRGLQSFLRIHRTDLGHVLAALVTPLFCLAICIPLNWKAAGITACAAIYAWGLVQTARECHRPLIMEFEPGISLAHGILQSTAGLIFAGLSLSEMIPSSQWPTGWPDRTLTQYGVVFLGIVASILSCFVLGYIVVRRLVMKLEHLSHHDALTGLLNRRAFEHLLDREVVRMQRYGEHFTLLMLDVDHFKRINDCYGHAAGDAVLCAVSATLKEHAREVDRVARFGGEEFCLLLPQTLHEGAMLAAERLRQAVSQTSVAWNGELIKVTISTGLATSQGREEPLSALLHRADEALYRAKAEGRNRVVCAPLLHLA